MEKIGRLADASAPRPHSARKPKRYLTKPEVARRYGWKAGSSVDRGWRVYGSIPPPTIYQGRRPLWAEDILDAHDAAHAFDADA
jgi:hypothetical protein